MREVRSCNHDVMCDAPVDCEVGAWEEWSACTATCGGGEQVRNREIVTLNNLSGKKCDQSLLSEIRACGEEDCPGITSNKME